MIGNFRIASRLGAGGMGEVFLAEQSQIGTKVAIKLLRPELSSHKAHVDRFFNEALAVSRIKHAGIVKIFDVGFHPTGAAYLVMELLEGESLAGRLARVGRLPLAQICDVGRQIANILDATHAAGITHRDLKPDNIFLVPDAELASRERAKILDFGIAKLSGTMAGASPKTVGTMGTPGYMAPEQWGDSSKVDWRADTYSVGCLAFEMACGRQPFPAETFPESYAKHLTEPPPHARALVPALPEALEVLLIQMLAKQPADRPAMADIGARFEAIGRGVAFAGAVGGTPSSPGSLVAPTLPPAVTPMAATPVGATPPGLAPADTPPNNTPPAITPPAITPAAVTPAGVTPNTTPGASAGERATTPPAKSRKGLVLALGGFGAAGATVAIVMATRGGSEKDAEPLVAPTTKVVVIAETPDAAPANASLRQRIENSNPFVDAAGTKLSSHQVTNLEYSWYVGTLAGDAGAGGRPLNADWKPEAAPDQPVAWVTLERARRFCEAIDASLPTDDQWTRAAGNAWGLDPAKHGALGPFEEWTATVHDGLATVRGGHAGMSEDDKQLAMESPMMKPTEALGGIATPNVVASAVIGFRCAR